VLDGEDTGGGFKADAPKSGNADNSARGGFKANTSKPDGGVDDDGGFKVNTPKPGNADNSARGGFKVNALKSGSADNSARGGFKANASKSDGGDGDNVGFKANTDYITVDEALFRIEKRRNVLGGVVLSGGEPTLFPNLGKLIVRVKSIGLKVKLDTNGMLPDILEKLFADSAVRPDYVAMDLKLAPERYGELLPGAAGDSGPGEMLKRSAALIRASGISHEFRTLSLPEGYFGPADRAALVPLAGDSVWRLRPFVPGNCLDPAWNEKGG
jgi:pyruvate formate lyase activating enzyme